MSDIVSFEFQTCFASGLLFLYQANQTYEICMLPFVVALFFSRFPATLLILFFYFFWISCHLLCLLPRRVLHFTTTVEIVR